ncbi:hypothetical protein E0I56_005700 [Escherichia coli]|nr:hypothetical protein [Escherichia coli]
MCGLFRVLIVDLFIVAWLSYCTIIGAVAAGINHRELPAFKHNGVKVPKRLYSDYVIASKQPFP